MKESAKIVWLMKKNVSPHSEKCPNGCKHSDHEHWAFDGGVTAGEDGFTQDECPYRIDRLRNAWLIGQSVGQLNRELEGRIIAPERQA